VSVAIVDYDMGNVSSVQKALQAIGVENVLSKDPEVIARSQYIILPGVGAFAQGMENIRNAGLERILTHEVMEKKKPFLAICIGLQLLASEGTEPVSTQGLGWIEGKVIKIEELDKRIPHLGCNELQAEKDGFFAEFDQKDFYFIHSYHFEVKDQTCIAARVHYGGDYVAAIQKDNIYATQFHPEKSQANGLRLIEKFIRENA